MKLKEIGVPSRISQWSKLALIHLKLNNLQLRIISVVHGGWATWEPWSTCSPDCHEESRTRTRTCTNPAPEHDGNDCVGDNKENTTCIKSHCPGKLHETICSLNYYQKKLFENNSEWLNCLCRWLNHRKFRSKVASKFSRILETLMITEFRSW